MCNLSGQNYLVLEIPTYLIWLEVLLEKAEKKKSLDLSTQGSIWHKLPTLLSFPSVNLDR